MVIDTDNSTADYDGDITFTTSIDGNDGTDNLTIEGGDGSITLVAIGATKPLDDLTINTGSTDTIALTIPAIGNGATPVLMALLQLVVQHWKYYIKWLIIHSGRFNLNYSGRDITMSVTNGTNGIIRTDANNLAITPGSSNAFKVSGNVSYCHRQVLKLRWQVT